MAGGSASTGRKNVDVSNIFFINMLSKAFAAVIILFLIVPKGQPDKPATDAHKEGIEKCGNFNAFLKRNETKIPREQLDELKKYAAGFQQSIDNLHHANGLMVGDRDLWKKRALAAEDSLSKYKCGPGYHFDRKEGKCIKDKDCPTGQHWDEKKGNCIDDLASNSGGGGYRPSPSPPPPPVNPDDNRVSDGTAKPDCQVTDAFAVVATWANKEEKVELYMVNEGEKHKNAAGKGMGNTAKDITGVLKWKKISQSSQKVSKSNIEDGNYDVYLHYYRKEDRKKAASTESLDVELSWVLNPTNANSDDRNDNKKKKDKGEAPATTAPSSIKKDCRSLGNIKLQADSKSFDSKKPNKIGTIRIKGGKISWESFKK